MHVNYSRDCFVFFFFQAEDGIRDLTVTGVQTCALPIYIAAMHDDTPGFERNLVSRTLAFYNNEIYLRGDDGTLTKIDAPNSAEKGLHKQWLTLELRDPWTVGGKTYASGSLLATRLDDFLAGKREFDVLFTPTATTSLAGATWTKSHLVLNVLDDVKNRLSVLTPGANGWQASRFVGRPAFRPLGGAAGGGN